MKRTICILLSLIMCCACAIPACALTTIDVLKAYFDVPNTGDHFPFGEIETAEPDKYTASIKKWYYYDFSTKTYIYPTASDTLLKDFRYTCRIEFTAKSGYQIKTKPTAAFYINGKRVTVFGGTFMPELEYRNGGVISGVDPDSTEPAEIGIVNYVAERTEDYRATITFVAKADPIPDGATIHFFVNDVDQGANNICTVKEAKADYTVQAKLISSGGETICESLVENVKIKHGFFDKLKAFFRGLFRKLPVITQEFLGIEKYE